MALGIGSRLGPYEIVAPLGVGGMGEVYRARDTRLLRDVAIKGLPDAFARDPERLARFEREAQLLAALQHPNIGGIFGLEEKDGTLYLVLELIEGESLATRLTRGALPVSEAMRVGAEIAAAIEAAHERGIVHRDLKPGNIMLSPSGVKVLDFGLAKSGGPIESGDNLADSPTLTAVAGTEAGVILGTAAYMSPEQARGKPVDRRSDVWSFGCVLFECLAGEALFQGETASDLIARILEREPDWARLPSATPPRVFEILRRCLRRDAEARPRDIRDVRIELQEILGGSSKAAPSRENSIAVLPFNNLSGPEDEYFADGMTDEILNALAQVEGLRVAARTSCFAFKGHRQDLRSIAEKLDVATLLEGTVRRAGVRLRITVQLVNAADGYQLWSERYDREMTDVFAVQDEIASAIATRLRGKGEAERSAARRGTSSVEAYELYLKGRALLMLRGRFIRQAIPCFERAIQLDPRYVDAMALLADACRLLGTMGMAPPHEVMPRAKQMAEQALEVAPDLAEAYATLGTATAQYDRDYRRAATYWERALRLDPRHVRSRCERANWSYGLGAISIGEAVEETAIAIADEPLNSWGMAMHCLTLGFAGRVEEAIAAGNRAVEIDPDSFIAQWMLLEAHCVARQYATGLAMIPAMLATSGRYSWAVGTHAWLRARLGQRELARAVHDELEARSRQEFVGSFWLATTASAAGLGDEALRFAARAVEERDPLVVISRSLVHWGELREDPRYPEVTRGVWQA